MQQQYKLLLLGGGHAHVQVMKYLKEKRYHIIQTTVIADYPLAYYSGMLPGCVASLYDEEDIQIDVEALAGECDIEWKQGKVVEIIADRGLVVLASGEEVDFHFCSVNIGSTTLGYDVPGVDLYALATRPISELINRLVIKEQEKDINSILVVGAGVAGIELAFGLKQRYVKRGKDVDVTIINANSEDDLGSEMGSKGRKNVLKELRRQNIQVISDVKCTEVLETGAIMSDGEFIESDLVVWATGAAPHPIESDLAKDDLGFIQVNEYLQSTSHPNVFGAGDCISIEDAPWVKKAGVYAVREGAILGKNILNYYSEKPMEPYNPQTDFLRLLMTGNEQAISYWRGLSFQGWPVWLLKDKIDRDFINKFKV
eukprot:TRINITY_DN4991_c0_g1_i2.p1 TRINITY_DN4991_c0_g1~~TRINITY_DN4991_c0_g1_i2.p1  ORF type:complete len:370 (-),score=80.89 TRINITY_DN4991_c0_g1_i2:47-1156(-)